MTDEETTTDQDQEQPQAEEEIIGYGSHAVRIELDDQELAEIARDHARTGAKIQELIEARKALNVDLNDLRGHRATLDKQVRTGHREEARPVKLVKGPGVTVLVIDRETGEKYDERPMKRAEMQAEFSFATTERGALAQAIAGRLRRGDPMLTTDAAMLKEARDLVARKDKDARQALGDCTDPDLVVVALAIEESTKKRQRVISAARERAYELGVGEDPASLGE